MTAHDLAPIGVCGGVSAEELMSCAMANQRSNNAEDLILLPTLLHLARHGHGMAHSKRRSLRAGSFVEYAFYTLHIVPSTLLAPAPFDVTCVRSTSLDLGRTMVLMRPTHSCWNGAVAGMAR